VSRNDVIVYDSDSHACIVDGVWLHVGQRFKFHHNDMEDLEKQLKRAVTKAEQTGGGILLITEGVFGMSGNLGALDKIVALKEKYPFRLLVDDAHGFGTMGETGMGAGEHFGVQDGIDLYFSTFAKSMAGIGAFIAGDQPVIDYLRYVMRSQIFAKSLPMPMVIGALKRLEILKRGEQREKLWTVVNALQSGLREKGFNLGTTESCVTPVFFKGNLAESTNVLIDLRENYNIFCSIVLYPVVPKGILMLRLIPTAVHTLEEVEITIDVYEKVYKKLVAGEYASEEVTLTTG